MNYSFKKYYLCLDNVKQNQICGRVKGLGKRHQRRGPLENSFLKLPII